MRNVCLTLKSRCPSSQKRKFEEITTQKKIRLLNMFVEVFVYKRFLSYKLKRKIKVINKVRSFNTLSFIFKTNCIISENDGVLKFCNYTSLLQKEIKY